MTAALAIALALTLVALWVTWRRLTLERAMGKLRIAKIARVTHELGNTRRALADMTASRDDMALTNAALRGEWEVPAEVADAVRGIGPAYDREAVSQ